MPQHGIFNLKVTKNYTQEKPNKWTIVVMPQHRMFNLKVTINYTQEKPYILCLSMECLT